MLQFPEHRGRQLLQGHTLQEQSFLLGEFLFLSNPPYEILVYWTDSRSTTKLTSLTALHHYRFPPIILLAPQVRVNGNELKKAPETRNVADVIPPILT